MNHSIEKYFDEGYVILDPIDTNLIDRVNLRFNQILEEGDFKTNSKIYSYNDSPRVVDAYKKISEITAFAHHPDLVGILEKLYCRTPQPFSNIVFKCGSEQPLHSDYIHHGTIPEGLFCGVWTALEEISEGSGELIIVPKSHKIPVFRYADYGLKKPTSLSEIKANYTFYETWLNRKINELGLETERCLLKKGQTVIWDANLAHGGSHIIDPKLTRRGFVVHYTFTDVKLYNPTFSFFKGNEDYFMRDYAVF
jgi:ectoine hydroxylase-related dioxygenase (phytanoyl-CoA dioxygenase family)